MILSHFKSRIDIFCEALFPLGHTKMNSRDLTFKIMSTWVTIQFFLHFHFWSSSDSIVAASCSIIKKTFSFGNSSRVFSFFYEESCELSQVSVLEIWSRIASTSWTIFVFDHPLREWKNSDVQSARWIHILFIDSAESHIYKNTKKFSLSPFTGK